MIDLTALVLTAQTELSTEINKWVEIAQKAGRYDAAAAKLRLQNAIINSGGLTSLCLDQLVGSTYTITHEIVVNGLPVGRFQNGRVEVKTPQLLKALWLGTPTSKWLGTKPFHRMVHRAWHGERIPYQPKT